MQEPIGAKKGGGSCAVVMNNYVDKCAVDQGKDIGIPVHPDLVAHISLTSHSYISFTPRLEFAGVAGDVLDEREVHVLFEEGEGGGGCLG